MDVGSIDREQLSRRDFPLDVNARGTGFEVVIRRSVINDIIRHGRSRMDVEICGVLTGNVFQDENGPFLYAVGNIHGEYAGHDKAQVTFTAETWTYIQETMDRDFPDSKIIGWYHTHPGFGVFLSSMDLFIHENFFNLPWQIAYVLDPLSNETGLFIWRQGKTERVEALIEEDEGMLSDESPDYLFPQGLQGMTAGAAPLADTEARIERLETSQRRLWRTIIIFGIFVLLWPFLLMCFFQGWGKEHEPLKPEPVIEKPKASGTTKSPI